MAEMRLQKILAHAGVASRRDSEKMIEEGRVRVNGKKITELGLKFEPCECEISVDGKMITIMPEEHQEKIYFLLNKPPRVLTSTKSQDDRMTVMDVVKGASDSRIYPVGRLDYDTSGALILTNDGDLANKLMHPKYHVDKVYHVKVKGVPTKEELDLLRRGIYLEDGPTGSSKIEVLGKAKSNTWLEVTLSAGRNRQIKRMFWRIKRPVAKLIRIKFAGLDIENLGEGHYRMLTQKEIKALKS